MTLLLLLGLLALAACTGVPTDVELETLVVEADRAAPTVTETVLADGVDYEVVVEGTYSVWPGVMWERVCVGATEPKPTFVSRDEAEARYRAVGLDAAFAFAGPAGTVICDRGAPSERAGWTYRTRPSGDWALPATDDPYSDRHVYRYRVRGEGAPLEVRIREVDDYGDNYGRLRLTLRGPGAR